MHKIRDVIQFFIRGDRAAFEDLLAYFKPKIWAYLRHKIPAVDADDVFQEICLTVLTSLSNLKDKDRFLPWLFSITRFKITDYHRRRQSEVSVEELLLDPCDEGGTNRLQDHEMNIKQLRRCIMGLDETYREIAVLHFIAGFQVREITDLLDMKTNTIKSILQRAKLKITLQMREGVHER